MAAEPVQKLFQDGSLASGQSTDTEYQLLEGAKAGDMELVKKICSGTYERTRVKSVLSHYVCAPLRLY